MLALASRTAADPEAKLFRGYLAYSLIGAILLTMPISLHAPVSFLDSLFTAVSAISTTGLVTLDTGSDFSFFGQVIILALIQVGGIGYMTFGSFLVLATRERLGQHRESLHRKAFSLPEDFHIAKFIRSVVIYTGVVEVIGAAVLYFFLSTDNRINPIWNAVFHSVSAFCTAGFSLYSDSFTGYSSNLGLNLTLSILSFLGAIGFIVMVDCWLVLKKKKKVITFTSKIILYTTFLLFMGGAVLILIARLSEGETWGAPLAISSAFQAMTAITTVGFNTIDIGSLNQAALFVITILMIVGASPSGTGGGIKSTSISGIAGVLSSLFSRNKEFLRYSILERDGETSEERDYAHSRKLFFNLFIKVRGLSVEEGADEARRRDDELGFLLRDVFKIKLRGRTIPFDRVIHALATFVFYFIILFIGVLALLFFETFSLKEIFFEAASALGTVGLSAGITPGLGSAGKIIIIIMMFIGRLGPLTFGMLIFKRASDRTTQLSDDLVV